jgi:hypothetical protein
LLVTPGEDDWTHCRSIVPGLLDLVLKPVGGAGGVGVGVAVGVAVGVEVGVGVAVGVDVAVGVGV